MDAAESRSKSGEPDCQEAAEVFPSPGAFGLLRIIERYARIRDSTGRPKGFAFPGQTKLAEELGGTERTVRTYLRELEAAGRIRTKRMGAPRKGPRTNRYHTGPPTPDLFSGHDRKQASGQQPFASSSEVLDVESYGRSPVEKKIDLGPEPSAAESAAVREAIRAARGRCR